MKHHSTFWKALVVLVVVGILVSVPASIYISGHVRNQKNDALCEYAQRQWIGFHALALRFTPPHSVDREYVLKTFGPYPNC